MHQVMKPLLMSVNPVPVPPEPLPSGPFDPESVVGLGDVVVTEESAGVWYCTMAENLAGNGMRFTFPAASLEAGKTYRCDFEVTQLDGETGTGEVGFNVSDNIDATYGPFIVEVASFEFAEPTITDATRYIDAWISATELLAASFTISGLTITRLD